MSEFELINQYFKSNTVQREDVLLGIGDDCAILSPPPGKHLATSTDTLISGVHFPKDTSPLNIGYKSLAVNLSDLAAMGAEPAWVSLAISLPDANESWLSEFMKGFNLLAHKYNVALIGGDTTRGALSITVSVTGFLDADKALRRNSAKTGDIIFVSGNLGDARMGLESILGNVIINNDSDRLYFTAKLNKPNPRIELGEILSQFPVAAIDLSDGLLSDLEHICTASSLGASIYLDKIPLSEELLRVYSDNKDWEKICNAGDDYELCFTCPPAYVEALCRELNEHHLTVYEIGVITNSVDINCYIHGEKINRPITNGYDHFSLSPAK